MFCINTNYLIVLLLLLLQLYHVVMIQNVIPTWVYWSENSAREVCSILYSVSSLYDNL